MVCGGLWDRTEERGEGLVRGRNGAVLERRDTWRVGSLEARLGTRDERVK